MYPDPNPAVPQSVNKTAKRSVPVFGLTAGLLGIVLISSGFKSVYDHAVFLEKENKMVYDSKQFDLPKPPEQTVTASNTHILKGLNIAASNTTDNTDTAKGVAINTTDNAMNAPDNAGAPVKKDSLKVILKDIKIISPKSLTYFRLKGGFLPSPFERNKISVNVLKMEKALKELYNTFDMVEVSFNWNSLQSAVKKSNYEQALSKYSNNWDSVGKVIVIGFTDNRGSNPYNILLGLKRAEKMKQYLIANGLPAEKITTVSFGAKYPVGDNNTAEGRAKNRRVEINLIH